MERKRGRELERKIAESSEIDVPKDTDKKHEQDVGAAYRPSLHDRMIEEKSSYRPPVTRAVRAQYKEWVEGRERGRE